MNELLKKIGEPAALENLAEECAELSHAVLKLARILRNENPTPVTEEEARSSAEKELADVLASAYISDLKMDADFVKAKLERADKRLRAKGDPVKHLVLCGPTGSGKSTLMRHLQREHGFIVRTSVTTRDPRDGESKGEYTFVDEGTFFEMVKMRLFDFDTCYKTFDRFVRYGCSWDIFESNNYTVSVMSYDELLCAHKKRPELFDKIFVVYLETPDYICQRRAIERGDDSFEVARRILSERIPLCEIRNSYGFDLIFSDYSDFTENIANRIFSYMSQKKKKTSNTFYSLAKITHAIIETYW